MYGDAIIRYMTHRRLDDKILPVVWGCFVGGREGCVSQSVSMIDVCVLTSYLIDLASYCPTVDYLPANTG